MLAKLVKNFILLCICFISFNSISDDITKVQNQLPDLGSTTGTTLSIAQERLLGSIVIHHLYQQMPLIHDPLLSNYINTLGQRLTKHTPPAFAPFQFYLIESPEINAFATFGSNIAIYSTLFNFTDTESQLASVMAHEISHVTQRHLAKMIENQKRTFPLTVAGIIGSLLLSTVSPEAGIAGLTSTMAGTQQNFIRFTQENEWEADRLGLSLLHRAHFDPKGMSEFIQKLLDRATHSAKLPEILHTHPYEQNRLSDLRNRINSLTKSSITSSLDYYLAKIRISAFYSTYNNQALTLLIQEFKRGNNLQHIAAQYGTALLFYQQKHYKQADDIAKNLLQKAPNNIWFLDLITDIDLQQSYYQRAITRLQDALKIEPQNSILQINLANAYVQAKQGNEASRLLYKYTYYHPNDINGWDLLAKASILQKRPDEELAARAEIMALLGKFDESIHLLIKASQYTKIGEANLIRYDARLDRLRKFKQRLEQIEKTFR